MPADLSKLPVAGDECDACRAFWTSQDKSPRRLVAIGKSTDRRIISIVVCPYCDGAPIIRNNGR